MITRTVLVTSSFLTMTGRIDYNSVKNCNKESCYIICQINNNQKENRVNILKMTNPNIPTKSITKH